METPVIERSPFVLNEISGVRFEDGIYRLTIVFRKINAISTTLQYSLVSILLLYSDHGITQYRSKDPIVLAEIQKINGVITIRFIQDLPSVRVHGVFTDVDRASNILAG